MLGSCSGLATSVKQKNPIHCIIHFQAMTFKTLPNNLIFGIKISKQLINSIKNSAFNAVFFKNCTNMDAKHETTISYYNKMVFKRKYVSTFI